MSCKEIRDNFFTTERKKRQKMRLNKTRRAKMDEIDLRDLKLDNYLSESDILDGNLETKILTGTPLLPLSIVRTDLFRKCC